MTRQVDPMEGGLKKYPNALGKQLAPGIPRFFSDVVCCYREGGNFYWSNDTDDADTKFRNLPMGGKLEPSFVPIVEAWKRKRDKAQSEGVEDTRKRLLEEKKAK
jgi:hypothetical protein